MQNMQNDNIAQRLYKEKSQLESDRANFHATWDEITRLCRPERALANGKQTEGEDRTRYKYDDTAVLAIDRLAASFRSLAFDLNSQFFFGKFDNTQLDENFQCKSHLDGRCKIMRREMYASNLSTSSDEVFHDAPGYGIGGMYVAEGSETKINSRSLLIANLLFTEDENGTPDTVFYTYEYTLDQAYSKFGDNLPADMVKEMLEKPGQKYTFTHVVMPRKTADRRKINALNMPYVSYWLCDKYKSIIQEGGYHEQPYIIFRWKKLSDSVWGFGPAHEVMPTIRRLNRNEYVNEQVDERIAEPPMWAIEGSMDGPLLTGKRRVNWGRPNFQKPEPLIVDTQIGLANADNRRNMDKQAVYDAFYITQLSLIDRTQMTATEVMQRTEENMRVLGPVFERFVREFLNRLLNRVHGILDRMGVFVDELGDPPSELEGASFTFTYESPLARAQRGQVIQAMIDGMQFSSSMSAVFGQSALDYVNVDKWMSDYLDQRGLTTEYQNSPEDIQAIREGRAQQQAQMAQAQAVNTGLQNAKLASDINQQQPPTGAM